MVSPDKEIFLNLLTQSLQTDSFVKLTLGKYRGQEKDLQHVFIRLVELKKEHGLSFLYRYKTKDLTKNCSVVNGVNMVSDLLGTAFLSARLFTLTKDAQLEYSKKLKIRLAYSKPAFTRQPSKGHDKKKQRTIEARGNLYLYKLGITNESGEVRERQGDKFRQVNKFIEIVSTTFESSQIALKKDIDVIDMGSGKGYLTFALYDYFNNMLNIKADVTGVEVREDLVTLDNQIAEEARFHNLHFVQGLIQDSTMKKADIVIALHACNTATDDAIYKGITADSSIIICAPCCHKQIRPQILPPYELAGMLEHGIFLERQAVMITDTLRALFLELYGYKTKVFEFISTEHTDKNIMIVGIKHGNKVDRDSILEKIERMKSFFGIKEHYLEHLLLEKKNNDYGEHSKKSNPIPLTKLPAILRTSARAY